MLIIGRATFRALVPALDAVVAHQMGDPVHVDLPTLGMQHGVRARTALTGAVVGMDAPDFGSEVATGSDTCTLWPAAPRVAAVGAALQHHRTSPAPQHGWLGARFGQG